MRHGTKLATTVALALTIFSGIAAVGATTGLLAAGPESSPGSARVIDEKNAGAREAIPIGTPSGTEPGTAGRPGDRAAPGALASEATENTFAPAPISAPMPATAATGGTAPGEDDAEPAPLPTTTPTTPVVVPPPPGLDCHGSDDGMSEAEKQARERACEGAHDDD